MDQHFIHLKEQANTGIISKEAKMCSVCIEGRKKLKGKYRVKSGGSNGKTLPRTNHKAPKTGLAALMRHPIAIKLHYEECISKGYYEQLPAGIRGNYEHL